MTQQEAAEEYSEPYRCPATNENEYCKHHIISAFNNGAKWQQKKQDEFAIEFAEWVMNNCDEFPIIDQKLILRIYKKEKGL